MLEHRTGVTAMHALQWRSTVLHTVIVKIPWLRSRGRWGSEQATNSRI
jgi:hypothetical protein